MDFFFILFAKKHDDNGDLSCDYIYFIFNFQDLGSACVLIENRSSNFHFQIDEYLSFHLRFSLLPPLLVLRTTQ